MGRKRSRLRLDVFLNERLVGKLTRPTAGGLEFQYDASWLDSQSAMPISCSLPLAESPYRGAVVVAYFDNLLPDDGRIRRTIAQRLALDRDDVFDLLAAIGRDCVGALRFVPEDQHLEFSATIKGDALAARQVAAILRDLAAAPLGMDAGRELRISIAGAQEKTALLSWKGRWWRPRGTTPTTHILKPPMGRLPSGIDMSLSVDNAWLCLELVKRLGLPVCRAQLLDLDGLRCLSVERFDRRWSADGRRLYRLPQEDLCQALGWPSSRKYQSDGGPGIEAVMRFLDASDARDFDRAMFMRAQIAYFLLGAVDGHAKNFSVFLTRTGFGLTPLYDVMSIYPALAARQVEAKGAKLAMYVGANRHYALREIRRRHWEQTAKACGFAGIGSIIDDLVDRAHRIDGSIEALPVDRRLLATLMDGVKRAVVALQ